MKKYRIMFFTGVASLLISVILTFTVVLDGWVNSMEFVDLKLCIMGCLLIVGVLLSVIGNENMFYE